MATFGPFEDTKLEENVSKQLVEAVVKRVKYIYGKAQNGYKWNICDFIWTGHEEWDFLEKFKEKLDFSCLIHIPCDISYVIRCWVSRWKYKFLVTVMLPDSFDLLAAFLVIKYRPGANSSSNSNSKSTRRSVSRNVEWTASESENGFK